MEGPTLLKFLLHLLLMLSIVWTAAAHDQCQPYPFGEVEHTGPGATISVMPGDAMRYDFRLYLNLSGTVTRVIINITAASLTFSQNDSFNSVTWTLVTSDGSTFSRNSSMITYHETAFNDGVHGIVLENVGRDASTFQGSLDMVVKDTAGAGDIVKSLLEVTEIHADNRTCYTAVASNYYYLPPPKMWARSESSMPVPLMGYFYALLGLSVSTPYVIGTVWMEMRTPYDNLSREVILTIQSAFPDNVNGFIDSHSSRACSASLRQISTFSSFQYDIGQIEIPSLVREVNNFTSAELVMKFETRAEDCSQLRDYDVVNVSMAMRLGWDGLPYYVSGRDGANFIWVSSVEAMLQVPTLDPKRPELNLSLSQKASCAFDGKTLASVLVELEHTSDSTATAYNVTTRVYLTETMQIIRHENSELRQNSLSVTQVSNVVYIDIFRMTFSDSTSVTLDIDINLLDPRNRFAQFHVITADAIFLDRWGNDRDMFTEISYVSLNLDTKCSQRVNWATSDLCVCSHNTSRADCACCMAGSCQCGAINPRMCQPCDRLQLCQQYLEGFDAIAELTAGDGESTFICDAHHRYRPWTKGVSCYKKRMRSGSGITWSAVNPIIGTILARDTQTGSLYGISNNGLAHMRSENHGVTWYTIHPEDYASQLATANIVEAVLVSGGLSE